MSDDFEPFVDEHRYIVWFRLSGEWVSRNITDRFRYLTQLDRCPITHTSFEKVCNEEAIIVHAFSRMTDMLESAGYPSKYGAGSRHKVGFYKQGVN